MFCIAHILVIGLIAHTSLNSQWVLARKAKAFEVFGLSGYRVAAFVL